MKHILYFALTAILALASTAYAADKETLLYTFQNAGDPNGFSGGVVFDTAGNLYGVGAGGGANNFGAIYELSPNSSGWTEQVLYSFAGGRDGLNPSGTLIIDANGNLYGATTTGRDPSCDSGCGTIFELSPGTSGWTKPPCTVSPASATANIPSDAHLGFCRQSLRHRKVRRRISAGSRF